MRSTQLALVIAFCSAAPVRAQTEPAWLHQPTRTVDGGSIVFIGTGEDRLLEKAHFKAQSMALQDLVNECTLPPRETRIDASYEERTDEGIRSYSKISIQFPDCEEAKRALSPAEIRRLANPELAAQLKRYQDLLAAEGSEPEEPIDPEQDETITIHSDYDLNRVQEEVATAKEQVILAPPEMYNPGSSETIYFQQIIIPRTIRVREYEVVHAPLRTTQRSWSTLGLHSAYHRRNQFHELPAKAPRASLWSRVRAHVPPRNQPRNQSHANRPIYVRRGLPPRSRAVSPARPGRFQKRK